MAKFAHANVLDGGLLYIKNNCNKIALLSAYAAGDSYATVTANILADAAMTSSDFTLSSSGNNRVLTSASGKQDTAADATGGSASNHLAFLNTTGSEVLWVTNETTGQVITSGNPVTFPSLSFTSNQPT